MKDHRDLFELVLRLKKLIKASFKINSSSNLEEALEKIVESTSLCLKCDRASCFVADHTRGELWTRVATGMNTVIRIPI
jgi:hypothetical protein